MSMTLPFFLSFLTNEQGHPEKAEAVEAYKKELKEGAGGGRKKK